MVKIFDVPFASSGDKTAIPTAPQVNGSVSYAQGFGPKYSEDQASDPNALDVPKNQTNELYYNITDAIKQYQTDGACDFSTLLVYNKYSHVRFDDGLNGVQLYESLADMNTAFPTDATKWRVISANASITPALIQNSDFTFSIASGTANAIILAPSPTYDPYQPGTTISFLATQTNTGATTVNVNGLGVKQLKVQTPAGLINLTGGEIKAGSIYTLYYDGANFQLLNPSVTKSLSALVSSSVTTQVFPALTTNKLVFDTVVSDSFSWWNPSLNRFTPTISGRFLIIGGCLTRTSVQSELLVYRNGSAAKILDQVFDGAAATDSGWQGSAAVDLNAGDYVELFGAVSATAEIKHSPAGSTFQIIYLGN